LIENGDKVGDVFFEYVIANVARRRGGSTTSKIWSDEPELLR
jgi:hypothetical protein